MVLNGEEEVEADEDEDGCVVEKSSAVDDSPALSVLREEEEEPRCLLDDLAAGICKGVWYVIVSSERNKCKWQCLLPSVERVVPAPHASRRVSDRNGTRCWYLSLTATTPTRLRPTLKHSTRPLCSAAITA